MVVVAIVTGLIVHFVTKACVKQNPALSHNYKHGRSAERGPARPDNGAVYEPGPGSGSLGELVEVQPSPAYEAISEPDYL